MKKKPLLTTLAITGAIIAAIVYVPLPHSVDCAVEIRPSRAGTVYAGTPGKIEWAIAPKTYVAEGEKILQLSNLDLKIQLADLRGREQVAAVQLAGLKRRYNIDQEVRVQLKTQEELLASIRNQVKKLEEEESRLSVVAKRDGYVIPPPDRPAEDRGDGSLPSWSGHPLEEKNRGAYLTADDVVCDLGSPEDFEAVLIIDQGDIQLVREQQVVDIKLDFRRLEQFSGVIHEISNEPIDQTSMSMSSQTGGGVQTEIDPTTGMVKPRSVSYQARVPIKSVDFTLRPGYRGNAKVHVDPMSLGQRLWRIVIKTFNFEL